MQFKKLNLENIRSYENLEIEFPKGSVLLSGDIGSGKTSILLGLQFALFGLQPGQKGSSILRQGEDFAHTCLTMGIDDKTIVLERSIKKNKSGSIAQDSNILTIDNNREELSTSEMKERVIEILGYPKEFARKSNLLYKFTVYTPQEEMKAIIQERPEIRLDTLRHIFGIDRYKRIKENAGILLQKIKESIKIKEILASELNLIKEKSLVENENKIALAREINNLKIEFQNLYTSKQGIEEKLSSFQSLLNEKKNIETEYDRTQILLQGKRDLESRMKKEIILMQKQINKNLTFSEDKIKTVSEILEKHKKTLEEKNSKFLEINSQIFALESKKERPLELKNKIISLENCPTCLQKVGQDHKRRIEKQTQYDIEEINRELGRNIQEKESLTKEIESEKELIKNYENDKSSLQQDKIKFEYQRTIQTKIQSDSFVLDRTSNEIQELQTKIEQLQSKIETYATTQDQFDQMKKELQNISEIVRIKEITIATKNKEIELLKIKLQEFTEEIRKKEKIREQVIYLRGLQDWIEKNFITAIDLTEKNVMVQIKNEFSEIFTKWFSILVSDSLTVRLDEDFTPIITNQDYEIDYEFLSGGERTAAALAYRLSLNQVLNARSSIKTKGIVILDEPTDGFSTEQISKMRDIFEELKAEQVIMVSHEEKIEDSVDYVIRIRKEGSSRTE